MEVDSASEIVDKLREAPDTLALATLVRRVSLASAGQRRPDLASSFHAPSAESLAAMRTRERGTHGSLPPQRLRGRIAGHPA